MNTMKETFGQQFCSERAIKSALMNGQQIVGGVVINSTYDDITGGPKKVVFLFIYIFYKKMSMKKNFFR